jgi:two-component system, NtrC family, sensor kinase
MPSPPSARASTQQASSMPARDDRASRLPAAQSGMPSGQFTSEERLTSLEHQVLSRDATIGGLTEQLRLLAVAVGSSFGALQEKTELESLISEKSQALEREHEELQLVRHRLQSAQGQLLQAQKLEAIGSLAAGIAHEINTPAQYATDNTTFLRKSFAKLIEIARAYQELLEELDHGGSLCAERVAEELARLKKARLGFLATETPTAIDATLEGLGRISSIVRAMKEFSHPSAGHQAPIDLREMAKTTITVARNEWKYFADMETEFSETMPPVPCFRDELSQVVLNLIVNAAHAIDTATSGGTTGKGTIRVSTYHRGDWAELRVSDTGCGIPEAIRHRVFEPFFTTKPVGKGTGQGLAITYSVVVDKHKGRIELESEVGKGTTFRIFLPIAGADGAVPLAGKQP